MNTKPRILVIDDEPQILRALKTILSTHHYQVSTAMNGETGLALAAAENPDLIILDLGLPDMDGITVCTHLREWSATPIIVLSVRHEERDKVQALDRGADDYLVKPFGTEELLARIRVALRHDRGSQDPRPVVIYAGELTIDLARRVVSRNDEDVKLTATEFNLLAYLAGHADRVLTHQNILNNVWGPEYLNNVEYLRVFVSQLRKKLEVDPKAPRRIVSEPGVGYRFLSED